MGASDHVIVVCLLTSVFLKVEARYIQKQYNQYGYQPHAQYPQLIHSSSYLPYPCNQPQTYQQQFNNYIPYLYYPARSFPANTPHGAGYTPQNYYPYSYSGVNSGIKNALSGTQRYTLSSYGGYKVLGEQNNDPYANIETEIIDIDPKDFNVYKKYFSLEDNSYSSHAIDKTDPSYVSSGNHQLHQPTHTAKAETNQISSTSIPQVIDKHDVQTNTVSLKKTFPKKPEKGEKDAATNLSSGNEAEVITDQPNMISYDKTTVITNVTEEVKLRTESVTNVSEELTTTTESKGFFW